MEATTNGYKTIISKFNGFCRNCEQPYHAGDEIFWMPGTAIHPACESTMPKPETFQQSTQEPKRQKNLPRIPDGTYTIIFNNDENDYQTVKFETCDTGMFAGKRIASFLSGTDNESDYKGFAFVSENNELHCWKRFQHYKVRNRVMDAVRILYKAVKESGDEAILTAGEAYAMRSGRCCKCGRKLTVPASLHRGMGPVCSEKAW